MASSNRAVTFQNPKDMRVESLDFPKLQMPNGKKARHGVILRIVATNSAVATCTSTAGLSRCPRAW
ncbi:hypothetical protein ACWD8L_25225 [Streptomyces sp. NPDC005133]